MLIVLLPVLLFCSCGDKENGKSESAATETDFFYPVKDFFLQQIQSVGAADSIIYVYKVNGELKDSSLIGKEQFNKLAYRFIEHDIADSALKVYYRQSAFMDETTGSITFSYVSRDKSLPVQSMDVLVDTIRQDVKRIFITSQIIQNNDTIVEKLGWKNGEQFFINSIKSSSSANEETSSVTVKWKRK